MRGARFELAWLGRQIVGQRSAISVEVLACKGPCSIFGFIASQTNTPSFHSQGRAFGSRVQASPKSRPFLCCWSIYRRMACSSPSANLEGHLSSQRREVVGVVVADTFDIKQLPRALQLLNCWAHTHARRLGGRAAR